jgi:hypothetical protein
MDNRINEICRKISTLRAEMADVEAAIRDLINHDQDCTETSYRLMAMRAEVAALVGAWKAAGGGERLPTFPARLTRGRRVAVNRPKRTPHDIAARPLSR